MRSERFHFVWIQHATKWGLLTGLLFSLTLVVLFDRDPRITAAVAVVLFPAAGYVWGACRWRAQSAKRAQRPADEADPG